MLEDYFVFCFERNPFDRVISFYRWHYRKHRFKPTLTQFVHDIDKLLILKREGRGIYTIGDEVVADRICLYENLHKEMEHISAILGFPETPSLPETKRSASPARAHETFSDADRSIISQLFRPEIEIGGYS